MNNKARMFGAFLFSFMIPCIGLCEKVSDSFDSKNIIKKFAVDKKEVTLLFAGDTSFARGIRSAVSHNSGNIDFPLSRIAPVLRKADFLFLNLECVLSDNTEYKAKKRWLLHAPVALAPALYNAGVDLVSVSNNHALDLGKVGFTDTLDTLGNLNILTSGVEQSNGQAPVIVQIGQNTFAFLAYSAKGFGSPNNFFPRPHKYLLSQVKKDIMKAKEKADHVVVSLHRGDEYMMTPHPRHRREARALIDVGAELIIGHHPHVPQPVERYKKGVIVYSLGNFLFDMKSHYKQTRTRRGFMLKLVYKRGELDGVELVPINADKTFRPYVDRSVNTTSWLLNMEKPKRFSTDLKKARVTRNHKPCVWIRKPPKRPNQYMEWFRGRWACDEDRDKPYLTVSQSGERSETVFERGVWGQPQPGKALTISFKDIKLSEKLYGVAGVPDFAYELIKRSKERIKYVNMKITIGETTYKKIFPFKPGWNYFEIDTSSFSKAVKQQVMVELEGGSMVESGYLFDLWVE